MNDNDIIKALGYCVNGGDCISCMYGAGSCLDLTKDALDLINRQNAEIERLQHIRAELSRENEELIQHNRDLSKHIRNTDLRLLTLFEEKLKNKFFNYYDGLTESTCKSCYNGESLMMYEVADMITVCIESTVAEMTEEKE